MKKILAFSACVLALLGLLTGVFMLSHGHLDVVNYYARKSLQAVQAAAGAQEKIEAPDGGAWFEQRGGRAAMCVDAAPFVAAGLQTGHGFLMFEGELDRYFAQRDGHTVGWKNAAPYVVVGLQTGHGFLVFESDMDRAHIGYHAAMDHFNLSFSVGNQFEWARDYSTNEKSVVFALNPEPLIAAGVTPDQVEGWLYTQVPVMDENGKTVQVWKFLKIIDLRQEDGV